MSNIIPFSFENHEVRVLDKTGEPWWVLADVCKVLEINNSRQATTRLDDDEKGVTINDTLGGPQEMTIINESGLWSLVLTSRKPEARRFKKWITSEVIPTIRRTGEYSARLVPQSYSEALMLAAEQAARLEEITPKAVAYDELASMEGLFSLRESAKLCGWPERKFIARLQTEPVRWLYTQGITGRKLPYASVIRSGYMDLKEVTIFHNTTGHELVGQPMITQKGLARLSAILGNFQKAA